MKLIKLLFLVVCLNPVGLTAQEYWSKRYDLDTGNDFGLKVIESDDSNILIQVNGFCQTNTRECFGLMMLDTNGNMLWKTIKYDSLDFEHTESIDIRNDTVFAHVVYVNPLYGTGYVVKAFDMDGDDIGSFNYNFPSVPGYQSAWELNFVADRTYLTYTFRDTADLKGKGNLRAYNPSWGLLWEKQIPTPYLPIYYINIEPTADTGVVLIYTHVAPGGRRATIERYDKYGTKLWSTPFTESYGFSSLFATLTAHPDGSYFGIWNIDYFTGNPNKYDYPDILFKLDSSGHFVWQKMQQDKWENFSRIIVAQNGDVIGCGTARNKTFTDPDWEAGYIRRMDTDGIEIWDRRIIDSTGGGNDMGFYYGIELSNGDLLFSGEIHSDTSATTTQDVWIVKTDANGCLFSGCQDTFQILVPSKDIHTIQDSNIFGLLPNPFTDRLVLGTFLGYRVPSGDYEAAVYDLQGRIVYPPKPINPDMLTAFDMAAVPPGLYVVQIFRDRRAVQSLKALKE